MIKRETQTDRQTDRQTDGKQTDGKRDRRAYGHKQKERERERERARLVYLVCRPRRSPIWPGKQGLRLRMTKKVCLSVVCLWFFSPGITTVHAGLQSLSTSLGDNSCASGLRRRRRKRNEEKEEHQSRATSMFERGEYKKHLLFFPTLNFSSSPRHRSKGEGFRYIFMTWMHSIKSGCSHLRFTVVGGHIEKKQRNRERWGKMHFFSDGRFNIGPTVNIFPNQLFFWLFFLFSFLGRIIPQ